MGKIMTELQPHFEGYAPAAPGKPPQLHGYLPVGDHFSCRYIVKEEGSAHEISFCFFLTKEEAEALHAVMAREAATRSLKSETIHDAKAGIYMTCLAKSYPLISIPKRGFSFRFHANEDYDRLQELLVSYLGSKK